MDKDNIRNNIDWEEVENKISLICYKFDNLSRWHEDLAQELRIHAYYVSDNYYDLYNKAVDFWRRVQTRQYPEIPYFDLDILGKESEYDIKVDQYEDIVRLVREELTRPSQTKSDAKMLDLASQLLDIIVADIDSSRSKDNNRFVKSKLKPYFNGRLSLSWVSEELDVGYKRLIVAMKFLEDTVQGLAIMKKIEIPLEYLEDYYD